MYIFVELDGVVKDQNDTPIPTGVLMVSTLTVYNRLTYLTSGTREDAQRWLNVNKIVDFDNIIDKRVSLVEEPLSERQIKYARSQGPIELLITANPATWKFAFELGIPVVLFASPDYTRPEFRPDAPKRQRSWDEIERAIKAQNELRTQDARLSRAEVTNFE
jgi:hypothetical protein